MARGTAAANSGDAGGSSRRRIGGGEAQLCDEDCIRLKTSTQNALRLTSGSRLENLQIDDTHQPIESRHMLDLFGTGGQNGPSIDGLPATRRLLQAIRIEYIDLAMGGWCRSATPAPTGR